VISASTVGDQNKRPQKLASWYLMNTDTSAYTYTNIKASQYYAVVKV